jgi:hypothetical protein
MTRLAGSPSNAKFKAALKEFKDFGLKGSLHAANRKPEFLNFFGPF